MLDIFRSLNSFIKVRHVQTGSVVFRMHYSVTVLILVSFSLVVTTKQYVGDPIICIHSKSVPKDVMNTFCWIHTTYHIPSAMNLKVAKLPGQVSEVVYPGIGKPQDEADIKYIKYYQWVCFCLFFQLIMLDIFRGLKSFIKISHVQTDSVVFRMHYSVTVLILVSFSLLVTTRQYVGNPINCIHSKDIPTDVVNTFCWIHTTYHVRSALNLKMATLPGQLSEVVYPGIGKPKDESDVKYIKYYQWVCFCLFFQAVLFYIPRWLWKHWEGGKIHALLMDMDIGLVAEVEKKQKKKMLLDYLHINLCHHNWWFYKYFCCELLALCNVVGQIFLMDRFFDGEFMTLGLDVIAYSEADPDSRVDPLIRVFPRMTKCVFRKYGPSSNIEVLDVLCILPLNIVNEKLYVFLWFWFVMLAGLTLVNSLMRLLLMISPRLRACFLRMRLRFVSREAIGTIIRRSCIGDWFLLYMLGQNMDAVIFSEVMCDLARRLGHKGKDYSEA